MAYQLQNPQSRVSTSTLLGQVLGITAMGLCVTAGSVYIFQNSVAFGASMIAMLIGFGLLIAINATRGNPALSLMLFYAFAFAEGVGISPIIHAYATTIGWEVVYNAALTTGLGMIALGCVVYATGIDFRRFQGILMLALLGLIIVGVISMFTHFVSPTVYSWITLVIFSGFVLINFARIRAGGDGQTAVQLAVTMYLDAINIFLALLRILGGRSRD